MLAMMAAVSAAMVTFDLRNRGERPCAAGSGADVVVCGRIPNAPDHLLAIEVNGQAGRMLVDPGGPRTPICNPDYAVRARFAGSGPMTIARVGPVEIRGGYGRVVFRIDGGDLARATSWSDRPAVMGADCIVGPAGLDVPVVRFVLGPARPGARTEALPIFDRRLGPTDNATDARIDIAGQPVQVRFDWLRDPTALTAPAALLLAPVLGASLDGAVRTSEIWFDVRRPIRHYATRRPFAVGPLALPTLYARVDDYGDASGIHAVADDELGADDIIVSGRRPRRHGLRIVRVGHEDLARCESITFDKPGRRILLTC